MVSVLALSSVERLIESRSVQTKVSEIGIFCVSAKHGSLRRKSKDLLTRNLDNVSEWGDISIRELLYQGASSIKNQTKRAFLVQSGPHPHHIE